MLFRCLLLGFLLLGSSSLLAATPGKKRNKPPTPRTTKPTKSKPSTKAPTLSVGTMVFSVKGGKIKSIQQLDVDEMMGLAYKHFSQRKYKVAVALYKRMLKLFPLHRHRFAALYNLALSLEEQKRYKEAIGYFQKFAEFYTEKITISAGLV